MLIALLEDDIDQAELMQLWLQTAGHQCHHFASGAEFTAGVEGDKYELLILDWLLPDTSGVEMLEWARKAITWPIPILFVTQRDSEEDIVYALEHGADDYMPKPVKRMELLARVKALGRRAPREENESNAEVFGPYAIDTQSRVIHYHGQRVDITQKEFELATFLFAHLGRVLSRQVILEKVWGCSSELNTRTVDTHMSRLRKKLNLNPKNGWRLRAVYQYGYRLERLDQDAQPA